VVDNFVILQVHETTFNSAHNESDHNHRFLDKYFGVFAALPPRAASETECRCMRGIVSEPLPPAHSQTLETEIKFAAPAYRTNLAIRMLEQTCDPDPKFPCGIVSSIYYDSQNWDYLREKRDSDYLKTKVRLRWYESIPANKIGEDKSFAEIKYRIGSRRKKIRVLTEFSAKELELVRLDKPELLNIPAALANKGAPIRRHIVPTFVVRYCRRRFVDRFSNARISIDYDITSPRVNPSMLSTLPTCTLPSTVLEVKGTDGVFPSSLSAFLKLGFRKEAFSKYYECYRQLTKTFF
jgi:hypothetical protein